MALLAQILRLCSPLNLNEKHTHRKPPCSSARSDGSCDFVNSSQRIPTVQSSLDDFYEMNTVFFHEISPSCNNVAAPPFNASRHQPSVLFCDNCEDPILPEISPTPSLKEDSRTHSLRQILQLLQRIEVLRLCALPAAVVLQQLRSVCKH
jgi:hypothetical protein